MRRFLAATLVCVAIVFLGVKWSQRPETAADLELSLSFRSMQRLAFDESHLRETPDWRSESVGGVLRLNGQEIAVILEALPSKGQQVLSALSVEVSEDQDFSYRDLVLVRLNTEEAQIILAPPAPAPLAQARLRLNGRWVGEYVVVVQPFSAALMRGEGPLARRTSQGLVLSPHSDEFALMRRLASEHGDSFPDLSEHIWAVWNEQQKIWRPWGRWPEGWSL